MYQSTLPISITTYSKKIFVWIYILLYFFGPKLLPPRFSKALLQFLQLNSPYLGDHIRSEGSSAALADEGFVIGGEGWGKLQ
jgi:hypothetical protein